MDSGPWFEKALVLGNEDGIIHEDLRIRGCSDTEVDIVADEGYIYLFMPRGGAVR